jgi:DNA polymerase III epsilon subunit-like protein
MIMYRYIFGDTETTGLGKDAGIVEISWIETDEHFNEVARHYSLINPGKPIQAGAMASHGLTEAMVADAPTIEEFMEEANFPLAGEGTVLVAHNCVFDINFFGPWMQAPLTLCTLKAARIIYPDADNHKLATLKYYLGLEGCHDRAHSADEDVNVLIQLAKRMCADAECGLAELMHIQNIPRTIKKMTFGKYYGKLLTELPKDYVTWLLTKANNVSDDLRASLLAL